MDDHPPTVSRESSSTDAEPWLDSVTAELKAEFARLKREEAPKSQPDSGWMTYDRSAPRGVQRQLLSQHVGRLIVTIRDLEESILFDCWTPRLRQKLQFWVEALESTLETLAKLSALFAHSLQATLRTPLLLDGPELSGYRHRLR